MEIGHQASEASYQAPSTGLSGVLALAEESPALDSQVAWSFVATSRALFCCPLPRCALRWPGCPECPMCEVPCHWLRRGREGRKVGVEQGWGRLQGSSCGVRAPLTLVLP